MFNSIPGSSFFELNIIFAVYWIFIASYIEEYFWRAWLKECLYYRILDRAIVAFLWGGMYVVIVFIRTGLFPAIVSLLVFALVGYILWRVYWDKSWATMYLCHIGLNAGVVACWYLADAGLW